MNEKLLNGELEQVRTNLDSAKSENGPERVKQLSLLKEEIANVSARLGPR